MRYCPDCGTPHECEAEAAAADRARVEIVRLETDRDVAIARINASAAKDIAETGAEHDASHAEGVAEGMETALGAVTGDAGDEAAGDPVIVDTAGLEEEPAPEPEPGPDNEPPVIDVPAPPSPRPAGYWDNYR